ncbi:hypothetical protein ACFVQ0_28155 [Streptomyces sp. NPDC057900]|uniref:hypothetical protein n=1 Tax=Streptomyces sp. NPDC057900 TaxID=3346274 RepID=UPI0036E9AA33
MATEPWPATENPRIAEGITSPGIGGTSGHRVGTPVLDVLVMEAPLPLNGNTVVQHRVVVGQSAPDGRREVTLYSRSTHPPTAVRRMRAAK